MKIVFLQVVITQFFLLLENVFINVTNELKQKNEIIVISNMDHTNLDDEIDFEGYKIIRIRSKSMKKRDNLIPIINDNLLDKYMKRMGILAFRAYHYIKFTLARESIQRELVNEYEKALLSINDIDMIVSTCYPFEAIVAVQNYKDNIKKDVKIIPFLFDKFSYSPILHRNIFNKISSIKNKKLEKQMFQNSTKIRYVDS